MKRFLAWFEDFNYMGTAVIACGICVAIGILGSTWNMMQKNAARIKEDESIEKTEGGKFALVNFYECLNSSPVFGQARTKAACATEVVTAAKTLRGDQFANGVRAALAQKLVEQKEP